MTAMITLLRRIEDALLFVLLGSMIFLAFMQIVLRNFFGLGFTWVEPLVRQILLWLTLAGAMVATRTNQHITVDAVSRFLTGRVRSATAAACSVFAMIVCALLTYSTFQVFIMEYSNPQGGKIMVGLPLWVSLGTLPAAFAVMTLRFARWSCYHSIRAVRGERR